MLNLTSILTKFQEIVTSNCSNALARKHNFVQRSTSRVQGYEFAQAMMLPNGFLEAETLNSLAVRMNRINSNCNLTASALAQRINSKGAEDFMRACFEKVLSEIVKKDTTELHDLDNLVGFNRVLIEDSTRAELHEKLADHFKGSGGVASKSSVKIDYIFDYLSEKTVDVSFCSGSKPDQALANRIIPILEKDDFIIRDLGYFVISSLEEIEKKGAYFLSRWKVNEVVYESKNATEPLDLALFLDKKMWRGVVDVEVFVGKEKFPVRLIASLMDEEAVNARLREANRSAKRHGNQVSKKKKRLLKYSIFVTNVPGSILDSRSLMAIYRARWRIELIFKQWKSCLKVHLFKGYNKERFHCFLYGRLIMILLLGALSPPLMKYANEMGRELSSYKLTNYLIADNALSRAICEGQLEEFISQLLDDLPKRLCMEKRSRSSLRCNVKFGKGFNNDCNSNIEGEVA